MKISPKTFKTIVTRATKTTYVPKRVERFFKQQKMGRALTSSTTREQALKTLEAMKEQGFMREHLIPPKRLLEQELATAAQGQQSKLSPERVKQIERATRRQYAVRTAIRGGTEAVLGGERPVLGIEERREQERGTEKYKRGQRIRKRALLERTGLADEGKKIIEKFGVAEKVVGRREATVGRDATPTNWAVPTKEQSAKGASSSSKTSHGQGSGMHLVNLPTSHEETVQSESEIAGPMQAVPAGGKGRITPSSSEQSKPSTSSPSSNPDDMAID